jgi:hypothetical protein
MLFFVVLDCVNQEIDQSFVYIANESVSFLCALMLWFKLNLNAYSYFYCG